MSQPKNLTNTDAFPWQSLGNLLPPRQSIDTWTRAAGMDWSICSTPVRYMAETSGALGAIMSFDDQRVLYRSDTKEALSVVGSRYQVVQPPLHAPQSTDPWWCDLGRKGQPRPVAGLHSPDGQTGAGDHCADDEQPKRDLG